MPIWKFRLFCVMHNISTVNWAYKMLITEYHTSIISKDKWGSGPFILIKPSRSFQGIFFLFKTEQLKIANITKKHIRIINQRARIDPNKSW